ncbi:MAG: hypothetical protein HC906_19165 [Bacteroidales bacterium]|nr:hypothetical protein [Bacteroidales bacterium]
MLKLIKEVFQDQVFVNEQLLKLSNETGVKVIATNDVHFINEEDAQAHDRLLCISTGKDLDDENRMRYTRQEWLKSQAEMKKLFFDIPEAITNTFEIVNKVEVYDLNAPPIMPYFEIPAGFQNADDYLKHITYEGAEKRYIDLTSEIRERIDFELETIKKMGFPDYFLIVWDFIKAAREMGASVILVHGQMDETPPTGVPCIQVRGAMDTLNALKETLFDADMLIMSAAIADYRAEKISEEKIKKTGEELVLKLVKNPDILKTLKDKKGSVFI